MPETAPSPDYGRSIDRPFNERAMVLQPWGTYGTIWPVVHQWLGVRPDMGREELEVVPQVPPASPEISGKNISIGGGSLAVSVSADNGTYRTTVDPNVTNVSLRELVIGHTIPRTAEFSSVALDGTPVDNYKIRDTNRGKEVFVEAPPSGEHTLVVETTS